MMEVWQIVLVSVVAVAYLAVASWVAVASFQWPSPGEFNEEEEGRTGKIVMCAAVGLVLPLAAITVVIAAALVGGIAWLVTLGGRARESLARAA